MTAESAGDTDGAAPSLAVEEEEDAPGLLDNEADGGEGLVSRCAPGTDIRPPKVGS